MPWESIFGWTNSWALLGWIILAFAPQRERVLPYVLFLGCGLLAVTYAALIIPLMVGWIDDGGPVGQPAPDIMTLQGVMALFASPGGTTIGWIHYLAFDLFVGIWIARNADRHGFGRIIQIPILLFTLMAGPIGLLFYLILRSTHKGRPENSTVPS